MLRTFKVWQEYEFVYKYFILSDLVINQYEYNHNSQPIATRIRRVCPRLVGQAL